MPTYKLPAVQKEKAEKNETALKGQQPVSDGPNEWQRRVIVPVNSAILDALTIKGDAVVELRGTVAGMNNNVTDHHKEQTITLVITEVSAYPGSEEAEDEEEGMMKGFDEG